MSFTETDAKEIREIISMGVITVKYNDKEVTYRGVAELILIKEVIDEELNKTDK